MREAGVNLVTRRHLLLGAAGAGAGPVRVRLARPGAGPAARRRDRGRPGHRHRHPAAVAVPRAPGDAARRRRRHDRSGRAAGRRTAPARRSSASGRWRWSSGRRAVRRPPGRWRCGTSPTSYGCHNAHCYCDVSADGVPRLAARRATATSTGSTTPGAPRSGASATATGPRSTRRARRRPSPTRRSSSTSCGSPPTSCSASCAAERDVLRRLRPAVPVTTNFMIGCDVKHLDYQSLGRRRGRRLQRPLPDRRRPDRRTSSWRSRADLTRGLAGGGRGC